VIRAPFFFGRANIFMSQPSGAIPVDLMGGHP